MILDLPRFLKSRQPGWTELEAQLDRLEEVPASHWSIAELQQLHLLYQRACADLVQIRTFASEPDLIRSLEALVARAYAEIHETRTKSKTPFHFARWFLITFPRAFQAHRSAFALSVAITLLGCLFGAAMVFANPKTKEIVLPFSHLLGSPSERVAQEESKTEDDLKGHKATFSGQLMANNIRVSIFAFALGITFGIGTSILLFYNGVILGAVVYDYLQTGHGLFLAGWLLPHGSIEIPAILIAGQCGLIVGHALIGGKQRRTMGHRFRLVAPDIMHLIGGVAVILIWAAVVEAFVSQYHAPVLPYAVKIAFGTLQLTLFCLLMFRRLPVTEEAENA